MEKVPNPRVGNDKPRRITAKLPFIFDDVVLLCPIWKLFGVLEEFPGFLIKIPHLFGQVTVGNLVGGVFGTVPFYQAVVKKAVIPRFGDFNGGSFG